jgi:competence protein ComEA
MFERLMKKLNIKSVKTAKILLFSAIGIIAVFVVLYINEQRNTSAVLGQSDGEARSYATEGCLCEPQDTPAVPRAFMVYVSGEVYSPGVFEFYEGARVFHAIEAAGGLTQYADPNAINMVARIMDEQHIVVFSFEDNMPPSPQQVSGGTSGVDADGRVNINTATSEQLQTLPRIGPVTAGNIISHREARGGFAAVEEIMNVSGIGDVTFESIRDRITVD